MDILKKLGVKQEETGSFEQTLFYFIREFKLNPFDEEFEVFDAEGVLRYKIKKKGISIPLMRTLIEELNNHAKREEAEMKKSSRKR